MKEIGGYFGLEEFHNSEFYPDLIALNSARNALLYLLKAKKIRKIYIPYFLCDSVEYICKKQKCEYAFYCISKDFMPIFDKNLAEDEYLYIVNYYGQLNKDKILRLKEKYGNIILDNVQAFFETPIKGIDTIYSCRKFFGVPDGAYLSTDVLLNESLDIDISMERMSHVLGRFEKGAQDYYEDFCKNDAAFEGMPLRLMSKLTRNILSAVDYNFVKSKREENFMYLHKLLCQNNELDIKNTVGPYMYPMYCKNGNQVRKNLAKGKIFIATLWPNVLETGQPIEVDYAENILPLPCDQRYNIDDMKLIANAILESID